MLDTEVGYQYSAKKLLRQAKKIEHAHLRRVTSRVSETTKASWRREEPWKVIMSGRWNILFPVGLLKECWRTSKTSVIGGGQRRLELRKAGKSCCFSILQMAVLKRERVTDRTDMEGKKWKILQGICLGHMTMSSPQIQDATQKTLPVMIS